MVAKRFSFTLAFLGASLGSASAQELMKPLSAIDWLSDTVVAPDTLAPTPAPDDGIAGQLPPNVNVLSLDAPLPDEVGVIEPVDLGLPADLWAQAPASDIAAELSALPTELPPSASRFLRDLLMMKAEAPIDARVDDSLYFARIDKLLAIGHLEDAQTLIDLAPRQDDPRLFRRTFDIALLTGQEGEGCRILDDNPDILPTFPARIFCLARNGKWDVAALTLGTAESLGYLTPEEDALLLKFLDPELFEEDPVPTPTGVPSPLIFRLYDAIGERLATEPLPIAFAEADLRPTVGWKAQLRAAERLTSTGAMTADAFFDKLFERAPAASGGIWDRVDALQKADTALQDRGEVSNSLAKGWTAAKMSGVQAAIAPRWADELSRLRLDGPSRHAAFEIAVLASRPDLAERFVGRSLEDRALLNLLTGQEAILPTQDALSRAVRIGLTQIRPSDHLQFVIETRGAGGAILSALRLIAEGRAGDPNAVSDALTLLKALGLEDLARQTAVELLLEDQSA